MNYEASPIAIVIFAVFVLGTLGLSVLLGKRAKSSEGYFAAHGQIPWFVNGIAFAGDYLSAASFLGICGMIAFYGYDGFLYSIGFLAGWVVALFVVAEPMKRLGKFTFADALDARFDSKGIKLVVGISTILVSLFYLIPQMVGAGALIQPLLNLRHWHGVVIVGTVVTLIVVTAGMVSTTWVQFIKGGLLVVFSAILTVMILVKGFSVESGGNDGYKFQTLGPFQEGEFQGGKLPAIAELKNLISDKWNTKEIQQRFLLVNEQKEGWRVYSKSRNDKGEVFLLEGQVQVVQKDGTRIINGLPFGSDKGQSELHPIGWISKLPDDQKETGSLGPLGFFQTLSKSEVVLWKKEKFSLPGGDQMTIFYQNPTAGSQILRPGQHPKFAGIRTSISDNGLLGKLNFLSLMLALFCGTASLPHILIRYYTVDNQASARKSTIVGIGAIGFFYVLTLYLGLGAMTSGALDLTDTNMAAPLLAKSMNEWMFAIISAIAFTTVLGTVSGLILAAAGSVAHDLVSGFCGANLEDRVQVKLAKGISIAVGAIAIVLGILFQGMNVGYLVGWAFSIAASANLPALIMLLFWKRTTKEGIIAAVLVGLFSSLGWILLSEDTFSKVYGLDASLAWTPFSQPGIVTIPLGFLTLLIVSLLTEKSHTKHSEE